MRVGNFVVVVAGGREKDSGHVLLNHEQQYSLRMENKWNDRACDAEVTIDGKEMGAFRIQAGDIVVLERPTNENGRFTFYRSGSEQAEQAGAASVNSDLRGLVTVKFRPEMRRRKVKSVRPMGMLNAFVDVFRGGGGEVPTSARCFNGGGDQASMKSVDAGVTGLSGHSDQQFTTVANLNYDPADEVTINIRLVCDSSVRPLEAVVARSNVVPSPVG